MRNPFNFLQKIIPFKQKENHRSSYVGLDEFFQMGGFSGEKYEGGLPPVEKYSTLPAVSSLNYEKLRNRSVEAYYESSIAKAAIDRLVESVINTGLKGQPSPVNKILGMLNEKIKEWSGDTKTRFNLWADSKYCDILEKDNFYQLQQICLRNKLMGGETYVQLIVEDDPRALSRLKIKLIESSQISSPAEQKMHEAAKKRGNEIIDGVEVDGHGRDIAFYVEKRHSTITNPYLEKTHVRIPKYGEKTGRLVMFPVSSTIRIGEVRAIPFLSFVLHEILKIKDYTVSELQASFMNSLFVGFIKPGEKTTKFKGGINEKSKINSKAKPKTIKFNKPGIWFDHLNPGEEPQSFDTKRPNANFAVFVESILKFISASLNIPIEILLKNFNNNYSASRAAILEFWKFVNMERENFISDFIKIIYKEWLFEEIIAGRIQAKEYITNPLMREAWARSVWTGPGRESVDPLRDAKGYEILLKEGLTTRDRVSLETSGQSFEDNIEKLKAENEKLHKANSVFDEKSIEDFVKKIIKDVTYGTVCS